MTLTESIKRGFSNFIKFQGRASRSEYWWFILFTLVVGLVLSALDAALFPADPTTGAATGLLEPLWGLVIFLPVLSAGWRRLQDTGRKGAWILVPMLMSLGFVFLVFAGIMGLGLIYNAGVDPATVEYPARGLAAWGTIGFVLVYLVVILMILWWLIRPSQPGPNQFGPPPVL